MQFNIWSVYVNNININNMFTGKSVTCSVYSLWNLYKYIFSVIHTTEISCLCVLICYVLCINKYHQISEDQIALS